MQYECVECKHILPVNQFHIYHRKDRQRLERTPRCKACDYERIKLRRRTIIVGTTMNNGYFDKIATSWKITFNEYWVIRDKQDNKCACCKRELSDNTRQVHIDHKAGTPMRKENIRGILCSKCNMGLGHFNDNIEELQRAIDYLKGK